MLVIGGQRARAIDGSRQRRDRCYRWGALPSGNLPAPSARMQHEVLVQHTSTDRSLSEHDSGFQWSPTPDARTLRRIVIDDS